MILPTQRFIWGGKGQCRLRVIGMCLIVSTLQNSNSDLVAVAPTCVPVFENFTRMGNHAPHMCGAALLWSILSVQCLRQPLTSLHLYYV